MMEIEHTTEKEVACNGGDGALGHPKVFLYIDKNNQIVCPYCSKKYTYITENIVK
jgi:uncharacterized Zn-finger protein